MPRYRVCYTEERRSSGSLVIEAQDESAARAAFDALANDTDNDLSSDLTPEDTYYEAAEIQRA